MIKEIEKLANNAAAAQNIAFRVWLDEEIIDDKPTGKYICSVTFYCDVYTRPEHKKSLVADIENRRIITVPRGTAKRLFRGSIGAPGGQEYVRSHSASENITVVAGTKEQAAAEVLNLLESGLGRKLSHNVADQSAQIEVDMRKQMRADIEELA